VPLEAWPTLKEKVALDLKNHFFINIAVELVEPGKLPTYELKAKRFFDHRRRLD
jgi:phenylacetate-coenzyme A ligase PaaK-like adenylate-forming protein